MKRSWITLGFGIILSMLSTLATAQCPMGLFYADTGTGQVANYLPTHFVDVAFATNPDTICPMRTLEVAVDIPAGCSRAVVWVQFEGQPEGWTLNIGDSPTNNGYGGDAGSVPGNAEVQILNDLLSVYSAATSPADLDLLATQQLALADGALNFVVENQKLSWGQPASILRSTNGGKLFFIPDTGGDGRRIYVALNRVVANTARTGCGARRVLISFK